MSNYSTETSLNECMLSTKDNPYNPFENFDEWYRYDMDKGWDSSGRLARIARISDDMSDEEVEMENERAIDEIVKHDFLNVFIKVRPDTAIIPEKIETDLT